MKTITICVLTAALAALMAACGAPAGNTGTNANANANINSNANMAKPMAAAPTKDALFAMEKQANGAWIKGDTKFFDGFLSDKFVEYADGKRMAKADVTKMIADSKCDIKTWSLEDPQMAMIDADTAVISYKGNFDGTCLDDKGKQMKVPSPVRAASVYIRNGDKWQGAFHGENPIIDPKSPPKAAPATPAKKEVAKKDDKTAANSNAASNTAAPAKATPDPNTDALVKVELAGWEAWKAKDAKKLDDFTAKSASIVGSDGMWLGNRADVIKYWAEMPCENIKTVSVTDGFATALSPTVEMLTLKGTADGTCYGQKNGSQHAVSVYAKEGDSWKLAFSFSYPT